MRILVFCAHPDDAEFNIGSTLLQLSTEHELTLIVLTDGSAGSHGSATIRKAEQEAAARMLGATLVWGGKADCSLEYTRAAALEVAQMIRTHKPHVIFAPYYDVRGDVHDGRAHPDHRVTGQLVRDGARYARFNIQELTGEKHDTKQLFWFMLSHSLSATIAVPVADEEQLKALFHCHASQMKLKNSSIEQYLLQLRRQAAMSYPGIDAVELLYTDLPFAVSAMKLFYE